MDLFEGMTAKEFNDYLETVQKYDASHANVLRALRQLSRGFTNVKGGALRGDSTLLLDKIMILAALEKSSLLVAQCDERCEYLGWILHQHIVELGMSPAIEIVNQATVDTCDVSKAQIVIGTPHCVNTECIWTKFQAFANFGSWGWWFAPTEPDVLGIPAHYGKDPDTGLTIPFVQYGDGYSTFKFGDGGEKDSIDNREYDHPQMGVTLAQRMHLLGADTYGITKQDNDKKNGRHIRSPKEGIKQRDNIYLHKDVCKLILQRTGHAQRTAYAAYPVDGATPAWYRRVEARNALRK